MTSFSEYSSFTRINDLSMSDLFFQSGYLKNTKVSKVSENILSVLYFFLCVPINPFSSGGCFLDTVLAGVTVLLT